MAKNNQNVFIAKNLNDVFYHLNVVNNLKVLAGCTNTTADQERMIPLFNVKELTVFEKKERYIEIGSCVTLNYLISLGENIVPKVLFDALCSMGTDSVRNMATIGGNICSTGHYYSLYAALLALDARLEFRNLKESKNIPFSKFNGVPEGFILTKIRVPTEEWDIAIYRRVGPANIINNLSYGFAFLVQTQKDVVTNIKMAFCGNYKFSSNSFENKVIGMRLPITVRQTETLVDEASKLYDAAIPDNKDPLIIKAQFLNLLRYSLEQLM